VFALPPGGPGAPLLLVFGAGASLVPASEAGVFRPLGAGGSPTTAARGVTCSITWGFWSAETGVTKKKYEMRKVAKVPQGQRLRRHQCRKRLRGSGHKSYRGAGSASDPFYGRSRERKDPDLRHPGIRVWARTTPVPQQQCEGNVVVPENK
jgi:hypothetical protein